MLLRKFKIFTTKTKVNGENVESKTHAETVNKIIELAKLPSADINLLVVDRLPTILTQARQSSPSTSNTMNKSKSVTNISNNSTPNRANNNIALNTFVAERKERIPSPEPQPLATTTAAGEMINLQNVNVYPEIKVCEFLGYPKGTQLGLVVTSDDYSHDVIKVADESPACLAGICKGDIIIAVNGQTVEVRIFDF